MPPVQRQSRKFLFTWNNYPENHAVPLANAGARYHCYGHELAPTTGTPHLQGFLYYSSARSVRSVRSKLPGVDVRIADGSVGDNITYCSKDGRFHEFGTKPLTQEEKGETEVQRYALARDSAKRGNLDEIPADIFVRCYSTLKRIQLDYMPRVAPQEGVCGVWIYGLSGCGKTRAVYAKYPDLFQKPSTKWWDGYQGEDVVLVDDVDIYDVKLGGEFKHWADFCPFIAESKGGAQRIRPKKLFVTSQYKIEDIWTDEKTQAALGRRFVVIEKIKDQNILI